MRQIDVHELARMLGSGEPFELLDVRTPGERAVASIAGASALDEEAVERIGTLASDTTLVFLCHHGIRSQQAALYFDAAGFTDCVNVQGGIDAWSQLVDPSVPRY